MAKQWSLEAAIYSALRRAHRNSPEYREALKLAKEEYFIKSKKGKDLRRVRFKCKTCGEANNRKLVNIDQKLSVIPIIGKTDFNDYISRLFCGVNGLQILCKRCHNEKSKQENKQRREYKKGLKNER